MTHVRVPPPPRDLFTLAGTPVQADLSAPLNVVSTVGLCWVLVRGRYPDRSRGVRLLLSVIWAALYVGVCVIHSLGHVWSARAAHVPMDALLVTAAHWVTLYYDGSVPPQAHIGRAVGGPVANLGALVVARAIRPLFPAGPFGRDLLDLFIVFNALIGGGRCCRSRLLTAAPCSSGRFMPGPAIYRKPCARSVRQDWAHPCYWLSWPGLPCCCAAGWEGWRWRR